MAQLMREEGFIGYKFKGARYDAGDKFGFVQANIHYGLKNQEIRDRLLQYMEAVVKENKQLADLVSTLSRLQELLAI